MEIIIIAAVLTISGAILGTRIKPDDAPGKKALKITAVPFSGYVLTTIYC